MNKYGYDIYINKYVDSHKIGIRHRGSLSSEWLFSLEIPISIIILKYNFTTLESLIFIFASFIILFLIVFYFNKIYNKTVTKKLLNIFQYKDRERFDLLKTLDEYIQKHNNHNKKERFREKVKYLENVKRCVKEFSDHLI